MSVLQKYKHYNNVKELQEKGKEELENHIKFGKSKNVSIKKLLDFLVKEKLKFKFCSEDEQFSITLSYFNYSPESYTSYNAINFSVKSNSSKKEDKYLIIQRNPNYEVKIKDLKLGLTISDTIKYLDYALYDDVSEDFYDEDSEKEQHNMFKNFNKL